MVKAGEPVDAFIGQLVPHLSKGDLIIDGGNSNFNDTVRRHATLAEQDILFIGTGISGGEEGALKGPAMMPGGSAEAYALVAPIFTKIAAQVEGTPCCSYIGPDGAGHYVKMVHNGIEYGDMQLICEAYSLMKGVLGMNADEMHAVFSEWNGGELNSYLIEITADIFTQLDKGGTPFVDVVLDQAGQKGTGKWTSISALDLGISAPTIAEAVFARCISAVKSERVAAETGYPGTGWHLSRRSGRGTQGDSRRALRREDLLLCPRVRLNARSKRRIWMGFGPWHNQSRLAWRMYHSGEVPASDRRGV